MENRILIADPDISFQNIAFEKLSQRGFEVLISSSVQQTIEILEKIGCNALLLNIKKIDELHSLAQFIDTMDEKPIILYSNDSSEIHQADGISGMQL